MATSEAVSIAGPVFVLELPLELAPTMNVYSSLKGWAKGKLRTAVDVEIAIAAVDYDAHAGFTEETITVRGKQRVVRRGGKRRMVLVSRMSSRMPDEPGSPDSCGAKLALDRLVQAGVLVDDSVKWLERRAQWVKAKPGAGYLRVEVYEVSQ